MARTFLLAGTLAIAQAGYAGIWNEDVQGDLSGNHLAPDSVSIGAGTHRLIGHTGNYDRDYIHVRLAERSALTRIWVTDYVSVDDISFIGVMEGTVFGEDPANVNVANLLGYCLFGTFDIGTDILPKIGQGFGTIGFTPPLGGRDYTFWIQQTGDPTDYTLDFVVVPEPATLVALGAGSAALMLRRRRFGTFGAFGLFDRFGSRRTEPFASRNSRPRARRP